MPEPSESSGIVTITSPSNEVEPTTYETLIPSTIRRSTWFMVQIGIQAGHNTPPLARYDIATGKVGEEVDLLPDLGMALNGGTGITGTTAIVTSFPFVIERGLRLSVRIRSPGSTSSIYQIDIRLIE